AFIAANGVVLDGVKNGTMFFVLLPLRIGLEKAVLPFTWGFQWTTGISIAVFSIATVAAIVLALRNHAVAGLSLLIATGILITGITNLPWPFVLVALGGLGWLAGGTKLSVFAVSMTGAILS